jgi:predicted deacylase
MTAKLNSTFRWLPVTVMPDGSELRLPLHVVQGAHPGPILGLSGAIHGNEVISTVRIIRRVLELLDPAELSGTVMAVPVCNPLGAGQLSRHTPGDGQNANAAFFPPGHSAYTQPVKTVTEQITEALTSEFLAHLDYQIDFHDGANHHSVHMVEFTEDPVSRGMARAFNMPILLFDEWRAGQMWSEAERLGAKVIVAECGGQGQLANEWVERGARGTLNVTRYLDMLPGDVTKPPRQRVVRGYSGQEQNAHILKPREGGLIVPNPAITPQVVFDGQPVSGVPVLGELVSMYDLTLRQTFEAPFERTLLIAAVAAPSWHYPGNYAYILFDADKAEILD